MTSHESAALSGAVRESWRRFLDTYEPLRPELYRYCRHLTRNAWDAEDMTQEALSRAFVSLALLADAPQSPRAWLFRVASNAWINRVQRTRERPAAGGGELSVAVTELDPRATREAAGTLLAQLSPQERAAVVLKDAMGLTLEETAEALSTTSGAIKAALHRARGKLQAEEPEQVAPVAPAALDAFCAAFNARDLERLTALLLETATLEYPGFRVERGREELKAGSLGGTLFGCPDEVHDEPWPAPRAEIRSYRGEPILVWWSGAVVHAVVRVAVEGDHIASLRNYYHSPEVMTEVCGELGLPCHTHGYRPLR